MNCVVMKGFNDDELIDFVNLTKDRPIDVRFIEYMPFQGNEWNQNKMLSFNDMKTIIRDVYPELQRLPNELNDTSKVCNIHKIFRREIYSCVYGTIRILFRK